MNEAMLQVALRILLLVAVAGGLIPLKNERTTRVEPEVVNAVLEATTQPDDFIIVIMETRCMLIDVVTLGTTRGLSLLEMGEDAHDTNVTQEHLSWLIGQARRLRQVSRSATVVVVSDDPDFLTAFAEWSLEDRLLVWSTRLLVLTHIQFLHLQNLRHTLAMTNSMLLHFKVTPNSRCNVYVELPYLPFEAQPQLVGVWSASQGLTLTSRASLFLISFTRRPTLRVARVLFPSTKPTVVHDPEAPGGKRVIVMDPVITLFETIAEATGFRYTYVTPADYLWGVKQEDGSWNGMIGMMMMQEVDMAVGPFGVTAERAEVVDFTYPAFISNARIISGRGSPEVDPWGFLMPLAPVVWVAILAVLAVIMVIQSCNTVNLRSRRNAGIYIRVLLQQDVNESGEWWWRERVLVGVWMLATLVLTRSYAGNLVSLLAVRFIPMPIQSLRDVVDNSVTLLLQRASVHSDAFLGAEQGIMREVGDLQKKGRLETIHTTEFLSKLDMLIRQGHYILIAEATKIKRMMAHDFSGTGSCDFYMSREEFLPMMFSSAGPMGTPLIPALSRRFMLAAEAGLFNQFTKMYTPNYTSCLNPSTRLALKTSLAITNIWGMLVVLVGGAFASFISLILELLTHHSCVESTCGQNSDEAA